MDASGNRMTMNTRSQKYIVHILLAVCVLIIAGLASVVHAQDESAFIIYEQRFVPLADYEGSRLAQIYETGSGNLAGFVNAFFRILLSVAAVLAVLRIAWAGYQYMSSDAWGSKAQAKEILGDVTIGILLLLGTWLILYQINPDLRNLDVLRSIRQPNAVTPTTESSPFD